MAAEAAARAAEIMSLLAAGAMTVTGGVVGGPAAAALGKVFGSTIAGEVTVDVSKDVVQKEVIDKRIDYAEATMKNGTVDPEGFKALLRPELERLLAVELFNNQLLREKLLRSWSNPEPLPVCCGGLDGPLRVPLSEEVDCHYEWRTWFKEDNPLRVATRVFQETMSDEFANHVIGT